MIRDEGFDLRIGPIFSPDLGDVDADNALKVGEVFVLANEIVAACKASPKFSKNVDIFAQHILLKYFEEKKGKYYSIKIKF